MTQKAFLLVSLYKFLHNTFTLKIQTHAAVGDSLVFKKKFKHKFKKKFNQASLQMQTKRNKNLSINFEANQKGWIGNSFMNINTSKEEPRHWVAKGVN